MRSLILLPHSPRRASGRIVLTWGTSTSASCVKKSVRTGRTPSNSDDPDWSRIVRDCPASSPISINLRGESERERGARQGARVRRTLGGAHTSAAEGGASKGVCDVRTARDSARLKIKSRAKESAKRRRPSLRGAAKRPHSERSERFKITDRISNERNSPSLSAAMD